MRIGMLVLVTCAVLVCGGGAGATPEPPGEHLYQRHCSTCHGPSGKGDGTNAVYFADTPRDLRSGFLANYSTEELVHRIREGRALKLELDPEQLAARARDVEDIVAHLERLPRIDWKAAEAGWDLYVDRCQPCHGAFGKPPRVLPPGVRTPPDLSDPAVQRSLVDERLVSGMLRGHDGMPALLPRIPVGDAKELPAFVRLLSRGFELYSVYCSACHGNDGRPPRGIDAMEEIAPVVFDRSYFEHHDAEQIRSRVWHMVGAAKPSMPHLRWALSEDQARAIVLYLKSIGP